jgi:hypothetical protein
MAIVERRIGSEMAESRRFFWPVIEGGVVDEAGRIRGGRIRGGKAEVAGSVWDSAVREDGTVDDAAWDRIAAAVDFERRISRMQVQREYDAARDADDARFVDGEDWA